MATRRRLLLGFMAMCLVHLGCALAGCSGGDATPELDRRAALDSAFSRITDIDRMRHVCDSLARRGDEAGQMMALKQLGKLWRNNSRFMEAIDAHNRELELAGGLRDTIEMVRAINNLGTNFRRMGIMEEATSYHYQALGLTERYGNQGDPVNLKNRVIALNGIGNIYMTQGNYAAADSVLRAALEGERLLKSELGQAINLANIGAIKEHLGQNDSAWIYYRRSMDMNRRAGSELGVSLCHTHFGELYEQEGQPDKAIGEYEQAYQIMQRSNDTWHWMEACAALARAHIGKGDLAKAARYIGQSDSIAAAIGALEHRAQVLHLKYLLARRQGDSRKALDYYVRADALYDSVRSAGIGGQVHNVRIDYERQRRQAEFDLLSKSYESERRVKNIIMVTAALLVLLAATAIAFLLYTLRTRRRNERLRGQLERMRNNFFTNVTHEFRTPLTVVMGLSQQMMRDGADVSAELTASRAAAINRQGNNLLQLINQLLEISRVNSEIGEPDWRSGNVASYAAMLTEGYQVVARQKGVELRYAAQADRIDMDFPPYYMRRVLGNLLGNAIKFTPGGGMVAVTCGEDDGDRICLTVADTGCGIAPGDLPHIFDTFYTGQAVRQGDLSTGVGLSLVKQVVAAMGGTITVHSDLGKGTVFTVVLPRRHGATRWPALEQEAFSDFEPDTMPEQTPEDAGEDDARCRVLIVEDHGDVARYMGEQLQADYSLYFAGDGEQALAKAGQVVPDLIVTDLMMPEMDGYELCRRVRQHPVLNHIPVIIVTARCDTRDRIHGFEVGADAYLEKPFDGDELRARVAALLDRRRQLRQHFMRQLADGVEAGGARPADEPADETPQQRLEREITAGEREFICRWLDKVEQAMREHRVDLEEIASGMNMTSTQMRRKVSAITGMTPLAYINDLRMTRAAQLLRDRRELSVGDVADRCGYDDLAYFSRLFKQRHGMTPTQFRAGQQ